jgi:23S rRNA pseudouridine2604 synthase
MRNGVPILDTVTKKCRVEKIDNHTFSIILTEGLNRQIRRMCDHFGYEVKTLKRIRIMNISLGNLKIGKYRSFTSTELQEILMLVEDSSKTKEASL